MNKQQRAALQRKFKSLMARHGATREDDKWLLPRHGEVLEVCLIDDWCAGRWRTHNNDLLAAYLAAKGGNSVADETPESSAAWDAFDADATENRRRIQDKGLEHKYNWFGYGCRDCVDRLGEWL